MMGGYFFHFTSVKTLLKSKERYLSITLKKLLAIAFVVQYYGYLTHGLVYIEIDNNQLKRNSDGSCDPNILRIATVTNENYVWIIRE